MPLQLPHSPVRSLRYALLTLLALLAAPWAAAIPTPADTGHPRGYLCIQATPAPVMDGSLEEPAWQRAAWSAPFVDIEGDRRPRPRFGTRVKMLWDSRFFYVGARLEEPHVWGTLTQHDSVIFHDNDFELFLDPDGDSHEYYELEINALNTEWDLFLPRPYKDGGQARNEWEIPGLVTAVRVDGTLNNPDDVDRCWSVEMALPWAALGEYAHRPIPPLDGDQWRINFSRVEWRHVIEGSRYRNSPNTREDNWVWSPQGVIDMHRPEKWGYVEFARSSRRRAVRPDPTHPARTALHHVYYAQRGYREKHGRWATSLAELGISGSLTLRAAADGYRVTARLADRGVPRQIHLRQDGRIWMEPP